MAAIAVESVVKLLAFIAVGVFVTWSLFDGPADLFARAAAEPALAPLLGLAGSAGGEARFAGGQWFALTLLAALSLAWHYAAAFMRRSSSASKATTTVLHGAA